MVDYPHLGALNRLYFATGGRVDSYDAPALPQRTHEPDEDLISYLMNQQAMRAQGQIPPLDWAGDLSGAHFPLPNQQPAPQKRRYADGGEVEDDYGADSGPVAPAMTQEEFKRALDYLYKMQIRGEDGN